MLKETRSQWANSYLIFIQGLLRQQHGIENGFYSTLLQTRQRHVNPKIQVVHSRGNHWIVASSLLSEKNVVIVYDSLYHSLDMSTIIILTNLFGEGSEFQVANIPKQCGGKDCAISTALVHNLDPVKITFIQEHVRMHLIKCFETGQMSTFPVLE